MKAYSDWSKLLKEGIEGGYTLEPSNSGPTMLAVFIMDNTRDLRCGINPSQAYIDELEDWIKNNIPDNTKES